MDIDKPFAECDHLPPGLIEICRGERFPPGITNQYRATERFGRLPPIPGTEFSGPTPKMPSFWVRSLHFTEAVFEHAWNGFKTRTAEEIDARLEICRQCEFSVADETSDRNAVNCSKCGCQCNASNAIFLNKLAWASESCPDGRWT